ncbi:MAG: rhombosortase [Chromatiales bacterium]|nr:rhombosortase [Gammaproteobacteria bacterium]MBW6476644.1 rhombosortase [Chromatiales bacterium]
MSLVTLKHWSLPLIIAILALLVYGLAEPQSAALRYQRDALQAGEWWRLWSGHWVHLGGIHLLLNLAGLALIWLLVGHAVSIRTWLWFIPINTLAISLSMLTWLPDLAWYVGLSGLLHGMLLLGAVWIWRRGQSEGMWWLLLLLCKLGWELWQGGSRSSTAYLGGEVISEAHFYGALWAGLHALVLVAWQWWKQARRG